MGSKILDGDLYIKDTNHKVRVATSFTSPTASSSWIADSSISPFNYYSRLTGSYDSLYMVELVNDNPINFAKYGFAIGEVTSSYITFYCIEKPDSTVNLKLLLWS